MARHDEGFFPAKDSLRLFWTADLPESPRAHVAIVHGYGDHSARYGRVTEALVAEGHGVHAFDYRGHGRADGRRAYAEQWTDFVDDLEVFWARVRAASGGKKTFVLAHSHGALMAMHWLARAPEGLAGVFFTAPYFKLAITPPPLKVLAARMVGKIVPWMPVPSELEVEDLSSDPEVQRWTKADPLYLRIATPRWFIESSEAQKQVNRLASHIDVPFAVLVGLKDRVADVPTTRAFFEHVPGADKRLMEYPEMRHEPMNELGRDAVFRDISNWISTHL